MTQLTRPIACLIAGALAFGFGTTTTGPAAAQSRLSAQGLTATATAPGRITVGWRPTATQQAYWCAAAELATAQGLAQTARLARLDEPARFTDPQFSTDPADLRDGGTDRLGRSATGLYTFPRGNSLTVGFAASLCDQDHLAFADD